MWAYQGVGRQLYLSTYDGPTKTSQLTYPLDPDLEDEELSDSEPISDAMQVTMQINYDTAPSATTTIQIASEPTFTDPITLDTLPLSVTDKTAFFTIREPLNGFIRVYNTSDQTISSIFVNKQISTNF